MIPTAGEIQVVDEDIETIEQPTRTYSIDFENGRIRGKVDGLEAMRQAVFKLLITVRYENLIYSDDVGTEIDTIQGKSRIYVQNEIQRMVKDALLVDDRINAVNSFTFTFTNDEMLCEFTVETTQGDFNSSLGVNVNV